MVEFEDSENRLFIIPPYSDWQRYTSLPKAVEHFKTEVSSELHMVYPYTPVQDLCDASLAGFYEG
jgi:hypothetical protein